MDETDLDISRDEMLRRWTVAQERMKSLETEQRRSAELERELSELQAENVILKGKLEKLSGEVSLKNEQINELFKKWQNGNITFLLKENGELSKKWHQAEDRAEEAKLSLQSAQNALSDKEHLLSSAAAQANEKDAQIAILVRKFEELKAENQRLQSELHQLHSEGIGRVEEKIKEISLLRSEHEEQEQRLRQEVHEMETVYQEKDIELQKLALQLGQFKMQFHQESLRLQEENRILKDKLEDRDRQVQRTPAQVQEQPHQPILHAVQEPPVAGTLQESPHSPENRRVLLVESNPESVAMIADVLRSSGYEVFSADTEEQIVAACENRAVDVLLMNIVMDTIDVYSLSHRLVQDSSANTIPIILMASSPQVTEIFKQEGPASVRSYLYKPFSKEELLAALDFVISSRPKSGH